ncbi:MAG TPA: hypothetical protein DHL02_12770 [Achromobacter sp.]|nr:hypothetical protein [Achromobacter sp.]
MTIDITADQFDDYPETRFVLSEAKWHVQFHPVESRAAEIVKFDSHTTSTLRRAYTVITTKLPATE